MSLIHWIIGAMQTPLPPRRRHDERGMSDGVQTALLAVGAAIIAVALIAVISTYITNQTSRLP